ncbi:MAG: hypothetical protein AUK47_04585 [Deltaproteobacteria bacterium CG2_30_63_29]|nr:MAG: hypothetical protein AUK47_04585 [Deltaproteobacteria bacterium CG2_30_63_29]PJB33762.1 MAG: hypothetical protein CO108_30135 [Deltaproteobacteria bacterium CG_4_9_14_3_um_filter_63_12]
MCLCSQCVLMGPYLPVTSMIEFDDSHWPLWVVTFRDLPPRSGVERFLANADVIFERQEPFAWLLHSVHTKAIPHQHRARYAEWIKDNHALLSKYCLGAGFVVPTVIGRLAMRSIFLLQPPPCPHAVMREIDAGRTWCLGRLDANGLLDVSLREETSAHPGPRKSEPRGR